MAEKKRKKKPEWQVRSEANSRRLLELAEKAQAELDRKREASA